MTTVSRLLSAAIATDPHRPLLTFYDDATGERTELSGATLANWVAKTANLVVDGLAAAPGDVALVRLPPHWQTAGVLLGCWSAGLTIRTDGNAAATVAFIGVDQIAERPQVDEAFVLGLHPLGLPLREVPDGFQDYNAEVRQYGDRFVPASPVGEDQAELCADATRRAREFGIGPTDRVLIDADNHPDYRDWLLAPLSAGASTVLCRHLVGDHAAERWTVRLA